MVFPPSKQPEFSSGHKQVLADLVIDQQTPGPILHDFNAMLDVVKTGDYTLTATRRLSRTILPILNERLAHPLNIDLKRPQQKSYPPLYGLYLLLRASGLTRVSAAGSTPALALYEPLYTAWQELNPTEQYGTLLEAWLLKATVDMVGERGGSFWGIPRSFENTMHFYLRIPEDGLAVAGNRDVEGSLYIFPEWHNLGLMGLFGLIRIEDSAPEAGEGWRIDRITRTPVGGALLAALYTAFFGDLERVMVFFDEADVPFGTLRDVLQPTFPEWKRTLPAPEGWAFREGGYTFKVSLGRIRRRIAIDAGATLDDLAYAILGSVGFDSDHLWEFIYQGQMGRTQSILHPYMDEPPFTSEVRVGDLPLQPGQHMTFHFDFGDSWMFDLVLERVDPDERPGKPRIVDSKGEAPDQYGW